MGLPESTNGHDLLAALGSRKQHAGGAKKGGGLKAGGAWRVGPARVLDAVHADGHPLRVEMQVG